MIKDLYFPVTGASTDDAAIEIAAEIASSYGARLIAVVPVPAIGPLATPWSLPSATVVTEMIEEVEREARTRVGGLRDRLARMNVQFDVRIDADRFFEPPRSLARQARYADLSIIAKPERADASLTHAYFRALLFESGRPVLVVPLGADLPRRFRKLLVAWKPTREATRAVHDAIAAFAPESVEVLAVDPQVSVLGHGEEPGADIGAHIARHGIDVTVATRPSASSGVATTLLHHAAEVGADVVVAGGYGHARLREWVLGGATREFLEELQVPVCFSH
jgi:nucleotide-binding universal stress UspA family protein